MTGRRDDVDSILSAVVSRCDPFRATRRALDRLARSWGSPPELMIAMGKASFRMADAARDAWPDIDMLAQCVVVAPRGAPGVMRRGLMRGDHPIPLLGSARAGRAIVRAIQRARQGASRGRMVVLVSGGASSLACVPRPPVTLEDVRAVTDALLRAGADIDALNTVRRRIDLLKGGGLAAMTARWRERRVLILSDVMTDDLATIASGPMHPDPTTPEDALRVLQRFGATASADRVTTLLRSQRRTIVPRSSFANVSHEIIASGAEAVRIACARARELGYEIVEASRTLAGEASAAGRALARRARALPRDRARAIILAGETTVAVGPARGVGGRNQELALAAAIELEGAPGVTIASFGTDGVDGPTPAAGAVVSGATVAIAGALGLDARQALRDHDSHGFFRSLDVRRPGGRAHLITTGPTGTNVNDIAIALVHPDQSSM